LTSRIKTGPAKPVESGIVIALDASPEPGHGHGQVLLGKPLKAKDFDFAVDGAEPRGSR